MNDLLQWISRSPAEAFGLAIFLLCMAGILRWVIDGFFDFLVRIARAFTGKYPPPDPPDTRPIVKCDGNCTNSPCKCCVENECQVGCECASDVET